MHVQLVKPILACFSCALYQYV